MRDFSKVGELEEWMASEGVAAADIGEVAARVLTLVGRQRKLRQAERAMGEIGAMRAAELLNVCRKTIYNRAEKSVRNRTNVTHATA